MSRKVLLNTKINETSEVALKGLFEHFCIERGLRYDDDYRFLEDPTLGDLEDAMTDIDIDSALFDKRLIIRDYKHPYGVLVELIASTINRALRGPPCKLHEELALMMQEDDIVVDFNYDLLMDEALRTEHKLNDFGYNVNFFKVFKDDDWRRPEEQDKSLDFLKLHGSLNWLKCVECSSMLLMHDDNTPKDTFDIRFLSKMQCPRCGSDGGNMVRLLLPPIQTKEYDIEPYRFLWMRAAQRLRGIDRIAFLGYSFANTDFATRSLLRRISYYTPIDGLKVHFMNPSSEPEDRFKRIFPKIETPTRTESLEEFLSFCPKWR